MAKIPAQVFGCTEKWNEINCCFEELEFIEVDY